METSLVKKLPLPFLIACGLGVALVGFLLVSAIGERPQASESGLPAAAQADSAETNEEKESDIVELSDVETRESDEGFDSLTGNDQPIIDQNDQPAVDSDTKLDAPAPNLSQSNSGEEETTLGLAPESDYESKELLEPAQAELAAGVVWEAFKHLTSFSSSEAPVSDFNSDLEQQTLTGLDHPANDVQVVPTAVSVSGKKYSQQNPDPSEALSEALSESDDRTDAVDELDPESIVMPEPEPGDTSGDSDKSFLEETEQQSTSQTKDESTNSKIPLLEDSEESDVEEKTQGTDADGETSDSESVIAGELTADSDQGKEITIQNPSMNGLPVWFVIENRKVRLEPGQKFVCTGAVDVIIRFSRGGELGNEEKEISVGTWRFNVNNKDGWRLNELVR